jgi:hypothetical protein
MGCMVSWSRESSPSEAIKPSGHQQSDDPGARLQDVLRRNRELGQGGVYAVCSAHTQVIEAAIQQAIEDGSVLHVESTSSQVNVDCHARRFWYSSNVVVLGRGITLRH